MATVASPLPEWVNFYVIAGSAAGALTGLQFVVMSLLTDEPDTSGSVDVRAFGTPTVVQFCTALAISALMAIPWHSLEQTALCLGAFALAGLAYSMRVISLARRARYQPDAEDWFWYTVLPLLAYIALVAGAVLIPAHTSGLFIVALTTLVFLFTGIHNSWDTVTYIAVHRKVAEREAGDKATNADH